MRHRVLCLCSICLMLERAFDFIDKTGHTDLEKCAAYADRRDKQLCSPLAADKHMPDRAYALSSGSDSLAVALPIGFFTVNIVAETIVLKSCLVAFCAIGCLH